MMHRTSAVVAKEIFKLLQGSGNVGVTLTIDDVEALLCVRVVKMQMVDGLELRCGRRTDAKGGTNYEAKDVDATRQQTSIVSDSSNVFTPDSGFIARVLPTLSAAIIYLFSIRLPDLAGVTAASLLEAQLVSPQWRRLQF